MNTSKSQRVLRFTKCRVALPGALLLVLAGGGCTSHSLEAPTPDPLPERQQYREVNPTREVDILFLVDNSGSMEQEQANLAANFPAFMDELKAIPGGLPDLHVGVVSSDLGAGMMTTSSSCAATTPGGDGARFCQIRGNNCQTCGLRAGQRFITADASGATNNFTGDISAVFSCMARIGTSGCGYEHQLEAVRRALTGPDNAGFLRPNAYLAIIVITDEDDCSAPADSDLFATAIAGQADSFRCSLEGHACLGAPVPPMSFMAPLSECLPRADGRLLAVEDIVRDISALKSNPGKLIVAGIYGWPLPGQEAAARYTTGLSGNNNTANRVMEIKPICTSGNGSAAPGLRVRRFVESFDNHASFSICQDDFRAAMQQIGAKIRAAVGPPCAEEPLFDTDMATPEIEPDCRVLEHVPSDAVPPPPPTPLPRCAADGPRPCWDLRRNNACAASGHEIAIDRAGQPPPEGAVEIRKCLTCAQANDPRCHL